MAGSTLAFVSQSQHIGVVKKTRETPVQGSLDEAKDRRLVAMHLQHIENNPLNAEEIAMFEMFEGENWSHDRRLAYISERASAGSLNPAAAILPRS